MTDTAKTVEVQPGFEITETVVTTGYVDKDGVFHEGVEPVAVQTAEDVQ